MSDILPHDLLVDILLRLPAKSIGRFRCASKSWCTLLTDPVFTNMHLNRSNYLNSVFATPACPRSLYSLGYGTHGDELIEFTELELVELDHPLKSSHNDKESVDICGSCNGLLCLIDFSSEIICLWNPCTREYNKLPGYFTQHTRCSKDWSHDVAIGFGYNPIVNDYEVVSIKLVDSDLTSVADVYSVAKASHRQIHDIPYATNWPAPSGQLVNGALHWLAYCSTDFENVNDLVIAFDIGKETFEEVPQPYFEDDSFITIVAEFRGQLCICCHYDDHVEGWVMKEYGVRESWAKLFNVKHEPQSLIFLSPASKPLCCTKNGGFLLEVDSSLVLYNPKTTDQISLKIKGNMNVFGIENYKESIVRLNVNIHR